MPVSPICGGFQHSFFFGRQTHIDLLGPRAFPGGSWRPLPLFQHEGHRAAQGLLRILDALVGGLSIAEDARKFETATVPVPVLAIQDDLIIRSDSPGVLQ